ncbi:hypothetical protein PF005_g604 [Phytophthora fragariae]|uniref:Uncharacterized protein n=1 Tax=Phytophthora fragariae TaxID=53985 RepID=A0A6A3MNF3_9STRA|nr:hypothetical protein PF009_g831 [Phytophthora fragariae]KAE9030795.1 hypothetical protein PF011_g461 [Phytophthora fragariae]KAE9139407.1 hypothetical protein PF010_g579 [Phytophthora fragariae]KAE9140276.1 hypothetical protein PF007_g691 [Phytophthora fragariae]KAE9155522.1 hypothetical protein PF006_g505 [Phytophthora fragariae]
MKTPREAYIGVSASGAEEVEDESTAIVDQSTSAEIAEENDEAVAPGGDEELDGMDPALRIVRHSFRNTLGARLALTKLEECMDSIRVMPPTMNTKRESIRGPTSRPEAKKNDRRAKTRATIATTDPMEPDPMMYKCMSELLECLELELLGRVKDLQYLEKSIEDLMGAQPSQQPKEDTVRVTSRDFSAQECASIVG